MRFTRPHKTQETKMKLLAFCGLALLLASTLYHYKKQKAQRLFLRLALSVVQKEGLKGSGLQAQLSFRSTPSLVTQSNRVPAGGCGLASVTPNRVRIACAATKAEAAARKGV